MSRHHRHHPAHSITTGAINTALAFTLVIAIVGGAFNIYENTLSSGVEAINPRAFSPLDKRHATLAPEPVKGIAYPEERLHSKDNAPIPVVSRGSARPAQFISERHPGGSGAVDIGKYLQSGSNPARSSILSIHGGPYFRQAWSVDYPGDPIPPEPSEAK